MVYGKLREDNLARFWKYCLHFEWKPAKFNIMCARLTFQPSPYWEGTLNLGRNVGHVTPEIKPGPLPKSLPTPPPPPPRAWISCTVPR